MLNDATGFDHIYLACGYTDLLLLPAAFVRK